MSLVSARWKLSPRGHPAALALRPRHGRPAAGGEAAAAGLWHRLYTAAGGKWEEFTQGFKGENHGENHGDSTTLPVFFQRDQWKWWFWRSFTGKWKVFIIKKGEFPAELGGNVWDCWWFQGAQGVLLVICIPMPHTQIFSFLGDRSTYSIHNDRW